MAWHLRNIAKHCERAGCGLRADWELFNFRNASFGYYCKRHGEALVRERNKEDAEHA